MAKSINIIASALLLITAGCQKGISLYTPGGDIRFTAISSNEAQTKAAYSGELTSNIERIDWKSGDLIRICCAQASEPSDKHYADYKTTAGTAGTGSDAHYSEATISLDSEHFNTGLRWSENATAIDHKFYAVYPSPDATNAVTKSISTTGDVTGQIPSTQSYTLSSDLLEAEPVLVKTMMMVAEKTTVSTYDKEKSYSQDEVFLDFYPLTTALRFTIKNDTGADLSIKELYITSASHPLSGPFSLNIGTKGTGEYANYAACTYTGTLANDKKVTLGPFPASGTGAVTLDEDKTFTFTFMVNPCDEIDDLVFHIVSYETGGECYDRSTKIIDANSTATPKASVKFKKHHKAYINGLLIPAGVIWRVSYSPSVAPWGTGVSDPTNLDLPSAENGSISPWSSGGETPLPLK